MDLADAVKLTLGICVAVAFVAGGAYDVYALVFGRQTVSRMVNDWVSQYPIVAVVIGVLVGHFFWPLRK